MKLPSRPTKLMLVGAGSLLLFALVAVVVGHLSAPSFYLTRTIFWGESDYKDLERFPARTIHNAPPANPMYNTIIPATPNTPAAAPHPMTPGCTAAGNSTT